MTFFYLLVIEQYQLVQFPASFLDNRACQVFRFDQKMQLIAQMVDIAFVACRLTVFQGYPPPGDDTVTDLPSGTSWD